MTDDSPTPLRRVPRQDRSAQRFELILDATAALIDEVGYASLSTSAIAKRVEMSGPGIYRYFDGLDSIIRALATRNLTRYLERAIPAVEDESLGWQQAIALALRVYADQFRTEPGFRWLRLGDAIDRNLVDSAESNRVVVAGQLVWLFENRYDVGGPRQDLIRYAEIVIEMVDCLTARAFEMNLDGDEFFLAECERVVLDYLRVFIDAPRGATA